MGDNLTAINLGTGASASQVVCGSGFTCALLSGSNSVKCWGRNHYGYLALVLQMKCVWGEKLGIFFTIFVKSVEDGTPTRWKWGFLSAENGRKKWVIAVK